MQDLQEVEPEMDPEERAEQIEDAFGLFDDWDERYQLLIDMGRKLPSMPDADKTEENRVHGCQSQVWVTAKTAPGACGPVIVFDADSDSAITKGLISLLWQVYSGQSAGKILGFDVEGFLDRLGLRQHLSSNRRNGLSGMVKRIKMLAVQQASQEGGS
jgi:sulfur transfer protein SufE